MLCFVQQLQPLLRQHRRQPLRFCLPAHVVAAVVAAVAWAVAWAVAVAAVAVGAVVFPRLRLLGGTVGVAILLLLPEKYVHNKDLKTTAKRGSNGNSSGMWKWIKSVRLLHCPTREHLSFLHLVPPLNEILVPTAATTTTTCTTTCTTMWMPLPLPNLLLKEQEHSNNSIPLKNVVPPPHLPD